MVDFNCTTSLFDMASILGSRERTNSTSSIRAILGTTPFLALALVKRLSFEDGTSSTWWNDRINCWWTSGAQITQNTFIHLIRENLNQIQMDPSKIKYLPCKFLTSFRSTKFTINFYSEMTWNPSWDTRIRNAHVPC